MEKKQKVKFSRSYTFKGLIIAVMTLFLIIPSAMIQGLISERQGTRNEAVRKIDAKWSYAQTIGGPVLSVPFTQTVSDKDKEPVEIEKTLNITPEILNVDTKLFPEERYYGIYKTILYKSVIEISGEFAAVSGDIIPGSVPDWSRAFIKLGVSDMRGISENISFRLNGRSYEVEMGGYSDPLINEALVVALANLELNEKLEFKCILELKGSGSINFLPIGRTTTVAVSGAWTAPGFVGNYTPEYTLDDSGFGAAWQVLRFNRNIPDMWVNNEINTSRDISFGVSLIDTVDVYQQNMRSAKYALMFIVLTFVLFFFVEVFTGKRIHPIQYLLVGVALILFYTLLLSISEPLGFGWAYLISSVATIALITGYASSIFRKGKPTIIMAVLLALLYSFLYIILQLEDVALLAGSIGLFVILGIIMYFSRKINWYGEEKPGIEN